GKFGAIPEGFSEDAIKAVTESKEGILTKTLAVDDLVIYEIEIKGVTVRFKYLRNEDRLFSEVKEVVACQP
ncbi:MAG: hypothetical protein JXO44_15395, partial [Clostridia bacterium]|nr:hypothetical protein [Clostridia bacterium]